MNNVMGATDQSASSCTGQDADIWKDPLLHIWQPLVREVVGEYSNTAHLRF